MIVLYDDAQARRFEPFATTRPLGEMRAGALLVRERWQQVLATGVSHFVSSPHLHGFTEPDAPPALTGPLPTHGWLVNARALPYLDQSPGEAHALTIGGRVAAVRVEAVRGEWGHASAREGVESSSVVSPALTSLDASLHEGTLHLDGAAAEHAREIEGLWLDDVWDLVGQLVPLLQRDLPVLAAQLDVHALPGATSNAGDAHVLGPHAVWLERGARVEPLSVFDTSAGPVLLRAGATVQAFTRMVGPCYVGRDSIVSTDRVAASSIGDTCRVHGEFSNSIMIGHANKGHDGFVGHSILGRWVNLGAGTITSNLKNTYGSVALWTPHGVRDTGLQFLGTLFGDHVKTGIGLRLTTGSVLGAGANVFEHMPPKAVPPFAWGNGAPWGHFAVDKFVDTAARMMARRQVVLDDAARAWWRTVHAHAETVSYWPRT